MDVFVRRYHGLSKENTESFNSQGSEDDFTPVVCKQHQSCRFYLLAEQPISGSDHPDSAYLAGGIKPFPGDWLANELPLAQAPLKPVLQLWTCLTLFSLQAVRTRFTLARLTQDVGSFVALHLVGSLKLQFEILCTPLGAPFFRTLRVSVGKFLIWCCPVPRQHLTRYLVVRSVALLRQLR